MKKRRRMDSNKMKVYVLNKADGLERYMHDTFLAVHQISPIHEKTHGEKN